MFKAVGEDLAPTKRATSKGIVAPGFNPGEGGVNPTEALQSSAQLR
jgi:hypothetical protein